MARLSPLLVTLLLFAIAWSTPTVSADHDWGHRYMVYGRVLDAAGEPAQDVPVRVRVETIKGQDPYMTVRTDCLGLYYTLKAGTDTAGAYGEAPDWGVTGDMMHIHTSEYRPRGSYHVQVYDGADEVFHGAWRTDVDRQRSTQGIQLDHEVPSSPACPVADWNSTYVVTGRIQTETALEGGAERHDAMSLDGERHTVEVTIRTADGEEVQMVDTNQVGDYFAHFQGVRVAPGDRITVRYGEVEREGTVDGTFRMTTVHAFVEAPFISQTTLAIVLVAAGLMLVGGVGIWAFVRMRATRAGRAP